MRRDQPVAGWLATVGQAVYRQAKRRTSYNKTYMPVSLNKTHPIFKQFVIYLFVLITLTHVYTSTRVASSTVTSKRSACGGRKRAAATDGQICGSCFHRCRRWSAEEFCYALCVLLFIFLIKDYIHILFLRRNHASHYRHCHSRRVIASAHPFRRPWRVQRRYNRATPHDTAYKRVKGQEDRLHFPVR